MLFVIVIMPQWQSNIIIKSVYEMDWLLQSILKALSAIIAMIHFMINLLVNTLTST